MIIVNFRTPDLTIGAVESALAEPDVTEVIVVENGSGDDSLERLQEALSGNEKVKIVASKENLGFGKGNNLGVESAASEFLFFLNSDALIQAGSLAILTQSWLETDAILAPSIYLADGKLQPHTFGAFPTAKALLTRQTKKFDPNELQPDWVSGCAMFMRRDDFLAVGGFDREIFMYFEDVVLCCEVKQASQKLIRRIPEARVTHFDSGSAKSAKSQKIQYYASQDIMLERLGEPALVRLLVKIARKLLGK